MTNQPIKFSQRLAAFLKLIRANNLAILFITQVFVRLFLIGPRYIISGDRYFLLISFSSICIAASGYIINDYYDVKIDIINKPGRVVIDRIIRRRPAIFIHLTFVVLGTVLGLLVSWQIGLINCLAAFLLWLYSNSLKRLPLIGNTIVSFLTAFSIYILAIHFGDRMNSILIFSIFSFFLSLIREIIKDMEDLRGDSSFGCKTLPIIWGIRKTKFFLYILLFLLTILLFFLGYQLNKGVLLYFLVFVFIPLLWMFYKLIGADTIKEFKFLSAFCKYVMISGVISMVFI
ncbi:MAG TPA: geranylgeranylglycerol-phosphate geranylgeranyltransferase [Cytophagaceae bacterium]|jgi:4-hydroxybenzoate polyprenyltransferase